MWNKVKYYKKKKFLFVKWKTLNGLIDWNALLTYPLCVTSVCLRPSLRNMSTTVSMGVWSVTVIGARSRIRAKGNEGGDMEPGEIGPPPTTNTTTDWPVIPSIVRRAFADKIQMFMTVQYY